ncbi:MAG TPA: hypothetical protein VGI40_28055 [Pirellulaceae bacterium]|jgi:hypothetical protein
MVFRGHVKNGVVLLDEPATLPEGAPVQVELLEYPLETRSEPNGEQKSLSIEQELAEIWRDVPTDQWANVPRDLSDNRDHYIYGVAKK